MRLNAFLVGTLAFALSQVAAHPLEISSSLARAEENLNAFAARASTSKNDKRKGKDSEDEDKDSEDEDKDSEDEDKDSKDKDKDSKDKDKDSKDKDKDKDSKDKNPKCKARSKTPRSLFARSKFNCGDQIEIDGKKYTLGDELGSGESGTVFELSDKVKGYKAVAKEYSHVGKGKIESENLQKVGQLIMDAKQKDGTVFAIMPDMIDGKRTKLYDWHAYDWYVKKNDNKGPQCKSFMKAVREAIAKKVADIAISKHIVHDDFTSNGNVLFEGQNEDDITVTLIDWGKTEEVGGRSKAEIEKMALERLEDKKYPLNAFKSKSASPKANAFSDIQCDPSSELYDNQWQ
ncbi:hypothetical protein BDZ89DRAFT_597356 [Hymenopellis radicata]|nr:hypothetical protein BDZ89DRAFT_597356 [Hymenopellis radicata]